MDNILTTGQLQSKIQKGLFRENRYLTDMSMAFFAKDETYAAKALFPILPVALSTGSYYKFSLEDLARDDVRRKPQFGKVEPVQIASESDSYSVEVDQIIMGIDQINQTNTTRLGIPGASDPRKSKVRVIAEKMNIHQDVLFADKFFKAGAWENEYTGVASSATGKQFLKFNNANFEPIKFFDTLKTEMLQTYRRKPNKLALGVNAFNALKENGDLLERIKYSGSSVNPAVVDERLLAELFGVEKVVVFNSTYNSAGVGEDADMKFICDPNAALLCYATDTPAIDEPSAGYTFTWDMLGNGQYLPVRTYEGENGVYAEFIEGLMAISHKKTCDGLAVFMKDCV